MLGLWIGCRSVGFGGRLVGFGCRLVGFGGRLVGFGGRLVGFGCRFGRPWRVIEVIRAIGDQWPWYINVGCEVVDQEFVLANFGFSELVA